MSGSKANRQIADIFEAVGKEHGYGTIRARYVALRDFKVRWTRVANKDWADFEVSDYIKGAQPDMIASLAESIFSKMEGRTVPYSEELSRWALSYDFIEAKQPIYISRCRGLTETTKGKCKDLDASFDRLVAMGLIETDMRPYMSWAIDEVMRKCGHCSSLMNVIVVSSYFDADEIPDYLLDYVVYGEWLRLSEGRKCFGHEIEDSYIGEMLERFPQAEASKELLERFKMHL